MADTVEPRTEAGRLLVAAYVDPISGRSVVYDTVLRCEREAVNAERARLRREMDAMNVGGHPLRGYSQDRRLGWDEGVAAVLALLETP